MRKTFAKEATMPKQFVLRQCMVTISLLTIINVFTGARQSPTQSVGTETASVQSWSGWIGLGKPSGGTVQWPVVGRNQDGRLEVFAQIAGINSTFSVYHIWQWLPGTWFLSVWDSLGSSAGQAAPAVGSNQDGRMDVLAQSLWYGFGGTCSGPHYEIAHIYQTAINNGWSSWVSLDYPFTTTCIDLSDPYVNWNQDGRLEVWAKGADGNVWAKPQVAVNGGWDGWSNMSKPSGLTVSPKLAMSREQDGRETVFVYATTGDTYFMYQTAINNGWSGWIGMGQPSVGAYDEPTVGQNQDGRQELFVGGSDGSIWHKYQLAPNSSWTGWGIFGKPAGVTFYYDPIVAKHQDGTLDVFVVGSDHNLWHICQTAPSDGWGSWQSLGTPAGVTLTNQLAAGRDLNGAFEVFDVGDDGNLYTIQEQIWNIYLPFVAR
jgi:hypothetical protein